MDFPLRGLFFTVNVKSCRAPVMGGNPRFFESACSACFTALGSYWCSEVNLKRSHQSSCEVTVHVHVPGADY